MTSQLKGFFQLSKTSMQHLFPEIYVIIICCRSLVERFTKDNENKFLVLFGVSSLKDAVIYCDHRRYKKDKQAKLRSNFAMI